MAVPDDDCDALASHPRNRLQPNRDERCQDKPAPLPLCRPGSHRRAAAAFDRGGLGAEVNTPVRPASHAPGGSWTQMSGSFRPSGAQKPCTERAGAACSQTSFCIRRRARAIASGLQPRVLVLAASRARVGWGRAAHSWSLGHHGACPDSPRECENLRTPYVRRRPARCRWPSGPEHLMALARGGDRDRDSYRCRRATGVGGLGPNALS